MWPPVLGAPIITSLNKGNSSFSASIPEITSNFAELIPSNDSKSIEVSIRKILLNPSKYQSRAENGRKHIIENFDWEKISKSYEDLIYKIIQDFKC